MAALKRDPTVYNLMQDLFFARMEARVLAELDALQAEHGDHLPLDLVDRLWAHEAVRVERVLRRWLLTRVARRDPIKALKLMRALIQVCETLRGSILKPRAPTLH